MAMIINDNKLALITEQKTFHFDLPKRVENSVNFGIDFIIKHNEVFAEHVIKKK